MNRTHQVSQTHQWETPSYMYNDTQPFNLSVIKVVACSTVTISAASKSEISIKFFNSFESSLLFS